MPDTIKAFQCRHIFADGHRCGSRSLRHESFCFYHHTTRKPTPKPTHVSPADTTFDLPFPEDRPSIQLGLGEIMRRIATNTIDSRRAGLLLYALQIASLNLPKPDPDADPEDIQQIDDIETHPTHGTVAPITEYTAPTRPLTFAGEFLRKLDRMEAAQPNTLPTLQAAATPATQSHPRRCPCRSSCHSRREPASSRRRRPFPSTHHPQAEPTSGSRRHKCCCDASSGGESYCTPSHMSPRKTRLAPVAQAAEPRM